MIERLYNNNRELVTITKDIIWGCRVQNYNKVSRLFKVWTTMVSELATGIASSAEIFGQDVTGEYSHQLMCTISDVLNAQENDDYILAADVLEVNMIPFLYAMQSLLMKYLSNPGSRRYYDSNMEIIRENDPELAALLDSIDAGKDFSLNKSYVIEHTESGYPTLRICVDSNSFYAEGNIDPLSDAIKLFDSYYDISAESYIVFGLGLAYIPKAICKKVADAVPVTIYEPDINIIYTAICSVDFERFFNAKYKIKYDPSLIEFASHIQGKKENDVLIMHHPSIRNISDDGIREKMEALFIQDASIRNQMFDMMTNFKSNIKHCNYYVDAIKADIRGKDVYIVAAGPSLDQNLHLLKDKPDNAVIIAVGRVLRKLHNDGISADYIAFLDASDRVYGQYRGMEEVDIPLIIASTAYRKIAENTKAKTYLACQKGMFPAEKYAQEKGVTIYNTGGSVATLAFDVALSLEARRIITLGLDLAYTNSKTHTSDAYDTKISDMSGLIKTKGIDGKILYTTRAMDIYKNWFENRIQEAKKEGIECEFYNATEGGALIKGMKNVSLLDFLIR